MASAFWDGVGLRGGGMVGGGVVYPAQVAHFGAGPIEARVVACRTCVAIGVARAFLCGPPLEFCLADVWFRS